MRPNIIFYFSDQQRWDTVNETVTPNLMKLAENGVNLQIHIRVNRFADRLALAFKPVFMRRKTNAIGMEFRFRKTLSR